MLEKAFVRDCWVRAAATVLCHWGLRCCSRTKDWRTHVSALQAGRKSTFWGFFRVPKHVANPQKSPLCTEGGKRGFFLGEIRPFLQLSVLAGGIEGE